MNFRDRRLGNRPLAAIAAADLASALVRRGGADDTARAASLWERAVRDAESMGMAARAEAWRARLGSARMAGSGATGSMRRHGRSWVVELDDHRVIAPDLVGMAYLAELVAHPGQPISAPVLAGRAGGGAPAGSRHEVIDHQARDAYAARARELMADLAAAEADNDLGRAEGFRIELDAIVEQLEAATGLGGRPRTFTNEHERARTSVRKAIKRAIDEIQAADPVVGEALRSAVVTGSVCMYTPASSGNVRWTVRQFA